MLIIIVSVLSTGQEAVGYSSSNLSLDNDLCDQLPIRALKTVGPDSANTIRISELAKRFTRPYNCAEYPTVA